MLFAALPALVLAALLQSPAAAAPPTAAQLRARLVAYERNAAANRPDPAELAAIATGVLQRATLSTNADAVVVACSSKVWTDAGCSAKLWAIARRTTATLDTRAHASAALVALKDDAAAPFLYSLVKAAAPARLAAAAPTLKSLPARQSVPILAGMLGSKSPDAEVAACRTLAGIDAAESRQVISDYLSGAPPGTPSAYACILASAALGDPANVRMAGYITNHLSEDNLVAAAEVLMNVDRTRAISHFLQATRESRGLPRLDAAERLASLEPEAAQQVMEQSLADDRPEIRAAALELHRLMAREPSREVRNLLLDPNPIVQVRAAETVLAADARRRG